MESYLVGIGKNIRAIRKKKNLYATEIAKRANVSNGLISRIENGRTIPSLPVLLAIIKALEEEPGEFFQNLNPTGFLKYVVIRRDEYEPIEKEDEAVGFHYNYIFGKDFKNIGVEVVLLELEPGCERDTVETDAFEFKYMLSGSCEYQIDDEKVKLSQGDSLFFDGRFPHVPRNTSDKPAQMLVFYLFTE